MVSRWAMWMLPLALAAILLGSNHADWRHANRLSRSLLESQSQNTAEEIALRIELLLRERVNNLALLANLWRRFPGQNRSDGFLQHAGGILAQKPGYHVIVYIDDHTMIMRASAGISNQNLVGLDVGTKPGSQALSKMIFASLSRFSSSPIITSSGSQGLVIWLPIVIESQSGSQIGGVVAGSLHLQEIMQGAVPPHQSVSFFVQTTINGQHSFLGIEPSGENASNLAGIQGTRLFQTMGLDGRVTVTPQPVGAILALFDNNFDRMIMGIGVSILAAGLLFFSLLTLERVRRSRRHLAESEKRYNKLINSAQDLILVFDFEGIILDLNTAAADFLQARPADLMGRSLADLSNVAPLHRLPEMTASVRVAGSDIYELSAKNNHGAILDFEISSTCIDYQGKAAILSLARDVSKRKKTERQLRRFQRMESLGTMAGGIAHDFNNLLGSILGYTRMGLLDAPPGSKLERRLNQVMKAGKLAQDLVRQILTFSREGNRMTGPINPAPIIKETLKLLAATQPKNIELTQNIPARSGLVQADPTEIQQLLINLYSNAVQAMELKGGCLDVTLTYCTVSRQKGIELGLRPGSYLIIAVQDQGSGVSPANQERIFEPCFTTKKKGEGTGMGLAVVHGIAKSHGGGVRVSNVSTGGARFEIYLPATPVQTMPPGLMPTELPEGSERVLLVDDDPKMLDLAREMVEQLGYRVEACNDAREAWQCWRSHPRRFDLLLSDLVMPALSGRQLARLVLKDRPDARVVIFTGFEHDLDTDSLMELGVNWVSKP